MNRSLIILIAVVAGLMLLSHVEAAGGFDRAFARFQETLLYVVPAFLIGIVLHEVAHAYVAYRLGDPTGKMLGRITLNPLKHLDPLGTLMIFVAGIGWANPVPINPANFRDRRRDMALAAAAGPATNVLIAIVAVVLINLLVPVYQRDLMLHMAPLFKFLLYLGMLNASLAVLNLIPVYPLDGHHFLEVLLTPRQYWTYKANERMISLVALFLLLSGAFNPLFDGAQRIVIHLAQASYWGVS